MDAEQEITETAFDMEALAPLIVCPGQSFTIRYAWHDDTTGDGDMTSSEVYLPLVALGDLGMKRMS